MYCIKCGAHLADGSAKCPICSCKVCHPDFPIDDNLSPYPRGDFESEAFDRRGLLFVISVFAALFMVVPAAIEYTISHTLSWSDFVIAGVLLGYVIFILPLWFEKPNPVIFLPIAFGAIILCLLYLNFRLSGDWFLTFAFPIAGTLAVIFSAVVTLMRYLRHGRLYVIGGMLISFGAFMLLLEFLMSVTFAAVNVVLWSLYPCIVFTALGMMLIVIAIVKPFKRSLKKMFHF